LSLELKPDYLLIDNYKARIYAEERSIKVIGTLGLIKVFYDRNFIAEDTKTIYEQLTSANFWIKRGSIFKSGKKVKGVGLPNPR